VTEPDAASRGVLASLLGVFVIPTATAVIVGGLTRGLGDAARYLTNSPDNVESNEDIRRAAVDLLERLHAAKETSGQYRYDRITVVGHSLGSVIAYDAVRHLWATQHMGIYFPPEESDDVLSRAVQAVEAAGTALNEHPDEDTVTRFQTLQHRLFRLLRDVKHTPSPGRRSETRWIVSDLITLGSPLAHAELLLASSKEDLQERFKERMLSRCPPIAQREADATRRPYRYKVPGTEPATRLHHASPFAAVRWTNLYFSHDAIGGPVTPLFGSGVRDVDLGGQRWFGWFVLSNPHSDYWKARPPRSVELARSRRDQRAKTSSTVLRAIIERRPTVYMKINNALSVDEHQHLSQLLQESAGTDATGAADLPDARLFLHKSGCPRRGIWIPIEHLQPTDNPNVRSTVDEMRLALSPDIRPPRSETPMVSTPSLAPST
jgi:hypothetical protein